MKIFVIFILSLFLLSGTNTPQVDRCNCKTNDHPYRSLAKHDTLLTDLHERKSFITVETVRGWEKKYPIDLSQEQLTRIAKTPEDTVYNLKGYVYEVKTNKPDCDLHLQVGPQDPKAMRVDIEIPVEECKLQIKVLEELAKRNFLFDAQNKIPIYFEAKGPGFFDGANRGRPGKKHTGGCSWELHPVRSIVFK